jgi:hypothetical protein
MSYHLRHTTYYLPQTNYLSFQQHSSFRRVTTFVFYNIPAFSRVADSRTFVFIDIPALFVHFLKSLASSFTEADDMLSIAVVCVINPANSGYSQTNQRASNRRQERSQEGAQQFTIHNSEWVPLPFP